ncbi:hypothetical protein [Algiphilus sp.]|uniref:hypothetical protein n=1 Tax=Algiphilus sp. TaxID=1872431 RepID=UPI003B51F34A
MSRRVHVPGASSTSEEPATTAAQPPRRRGRFLLWGLFGLSGLGVIVVGAFASFWLFMHLTFSISLKDQPMAITLPQDFEVTANVERELDILMNGVIYAQVPFQQELTLPLQGRYRSDVVLNADVPVQFDVHYDGVIPVDTVADIEIVTDFNYMGAKTLRNLNIQAKLPMQFSLPVQLTAPVDQTIQLKYEGPLVMNLDQEITTEVDTIINTSLAVNQKVSAPVIAKIPMHTNGPPRPIRAIVTESTIGGRVAGIGLSVADEDAKRAQRVESIWGPAAPPIEQRALIEQPSMGASQRSSAR